MKPKRVPINMIQTPYITFRHSSSGITITDNSEQPYQSVSSENYSVFQPFFLPKGVTNTAIFIEGTDIVQKFIDINGQPNTGLYGPMATYAYAALQGKFSLGYINMRPADATYPNFYIALDVRKAKETDGSTDKIKVLYVELDTNTQEYHMSFDKDSLPNVDTIVEVEFPYFRLAFDNYYIEDCVNDMDIDEFLGETAYEINLIKNSDTIDESVVHIPLWGLVYRGAGDYGNVYTAKFSQMSDQINDTYNYYQCQIMDKSSEEHSFTFATFDVQRGSLNMGFWDKATDACVITFTDTNKLETFRPYGIDRQKANSITAAVQGMVDKTIKGIVAKIKEKFPSFDETDDVHAGQWMDIADATQEYIANIFVRSNTTAGKTLETPLSFINPFDNEQFDAVRDIIPFEVEACPNEVRFQGGDLGQLGEKLVDGFSWDIKLTRKNEETGEDEEYKVFPQMLKDAYSGKTDVAIFDQSIIRDCIMFGDGYPLDVQEVMDDLCRYREDVINFEEGRCDFCYIRTPDYSVKTIAQALEWQRTFLTKEKNMNMHPIIGYWRFDDPTTGAQVDFQGFYDYLGSDSALFNYLSSGTSDSFASGDHSIIVSGKTNSQKLIPKTSAEREELCKRDIMYFKRRGTGKYVLGEDLAYNVGIDSVMKNIGSNIQFNRMMNIASIIMRDNVISNPTPDNMEQLKRKIEDAIKVPAQHFKDKVKVTVKESQHAQEIGKKVVLCTIEVTGHEYSRHNRLHMVSNRPESSSSTS